MSSGTGEAEVRQPETTETTERGDNPDEHAAGTSGTGEQLDEEYGDIHKIVLQGLLAAGFLDTKGVKKLFHGACTYLKLNHAERITMPYVQRIVREINENVKPYDMAIKSASCEFTGRKFYIFLITVENSIFKMQTLFSKFELELFQKCMDAILRKYNNYSVPMTECINFAKDCEAKGSLPEAEKFILRMIKTKYFAKYMITDKEFHVTMGFRGLREFEPLLKELYHEVISNCSLCKMVLLHGLLCPNCRLLVHKHCFQKFFRTSKECPSCKTSWSHPESKNEPIEMIQRLRDTAAETDANVRTPASQFDVQHASGDEDEVRDNLPAVAATHQTVEAQNKNAVGTVGTGNEEVEGEGEVQEGEDEAEVDGDEVEEDDEEGEEDEEDEEVDDEEEGEENEDEDEDENVEYEGEGEDQEEVVEDEENVEYEDDAEDEEGGEDDQEDEEDDEENEEVPEDEEENDEEEEQVQINVEPPPTPSIGRTTRASKRARRELNLSESDTD